ncbi:putative F-box domain-containing protein [Tanacetum coccineum]|uniref:F-box domain-containing protein n=1 Tax=Tanacetum coccineum TaxID=301880 RepID=A0ABQ5I332_9ASTR
MAKTRSMTREQKRFKTSEENGSTSWSDLGDDLLFTIMMYLGVIDFVAFGGVCKYWRLFTHSNWDKFMASRQPMYMHLSANRINKKVCFLEDFEGRKFKTSLPNSSNRTCIGLTLGYLILWGGKTRDFMLVNPITRHELHFPGCPFDISINSALFRGILIFSHSLSGWVFVIAKFFSPIIAFSVADEQGRWKRLFSNVAALDLHAFKEKIYQISFCGNLFEVRLDLDPTLRPLGLEDCVEPELSRIEFLCSGQKLCVVGLDQEKEYIGLEADVDKMKWVSPGKEKAALFLSRLECASAVINPNTWAHPWTQDKGCTYFHSFERSKKEWRRCDTSMWYFPHYCLKIKAAPEDVMHV